jgi:hypothetical protein
VSLLQTRSRPHNRVDGRQCPSSCPAFVAMVQSANFRECDHGSFGRRLNASCRRRVLLQGEMCSRAMIISEVRTKDTTKMRPVENDDVIQTLSANGTDQTFHVRTLPRTQRTGEDLGDPQAGNTTADLIAVSAVAVSQQPTWCRVLGNASPSCWAVHVDVGCSVQLKCTIVAGHVTARQRRTAGGRSASIP